MQTKFKNGTLFYGDVLESAKKIADNSVNCVITSPPYWQLRSYGFDGQWGLEPTYQEYLANLQKLMKEVWRILKHDGTCWVNLGDSYNNNTGSPENVNTGNKKGLLQMGRNNKQIKTIAQKCLLLIPTVSLLTA